jgi:DNA-binding XRE family transcriptional regulator
MEKKKKKKLESRGWRVGGTREFLDLTPEEEAYIELKLALSQNLRERRQQKRVTQTQLAKLIKSSQSRVAKMESCDPTVSIDLLIRSLLVLGTTKKELARVISTSKFLPAT